MTVSPRPALTKAGLSRLCCSYLCLKSEAKIVDYGEKSRTLYRIASKLCLRTTLTFFAESSATRYFSSVEHKKFTKLKRIILIYKKEKL